MVPPLFTSISMYFGNRPSRNPLSGICWTFLSRAQNVARIVFKNGVFFIRNTLWTILAWNSHCAKHSVARDKSLWEFWCADFVHDWHDSHLNLCSIYLKLLVLYICSNSMACCYWWRSDFLSMIFRDLTRSLWRHLAGKVT